MSDVYILFEKCLNIDDDDDDDIHAGLDASVS